MSRVSANSEYLKFGIALPLTAGEFSIGGFEEIRFGDYRS